MAWSGPVEGRAGIDDMNYWLLKSDPDTYSWADLVRDHTTCWNGVRNFQARNFLRAMAVGDRALFYHSQTDKAVMGEVEISATAYPDSSAKQGDWSCVDIRAIEDWSVPVSLAAIRMEPGLKELPLIKQGRLSVMPVTVSQWRLIQRMRSKI